MNTTINLIDKVYELNKSHVDNLIKMHSKPSNNPEQGYVDVYIVCVLEELKGKMIDDYIDIAKALSGNKK